MASDSITHINHGQASENLDLLQLANMAWFKGANIKDIHRIVVADKSSNVVNNRGIFPGLRNGAVVEGVRPLGPDAEDEARLLLLLIVQNWV